MAERADRVTRPSIANSFGLFEAALGLLAGYVLGSVFVSIYDASVHVHEGPDSFGPLLCGLIGLWAGFVGGAVVAVRRHRRSSAAPPVALRRALAEDLGLSIRLWPDVPLGIAVGVASQYLLVPLLELPLVPFVPHLFTRLGAPANAITNHVHGPGLVLEGVFICLGSPLAEEIYFRGLIFRGLLGLGARWTRVGAVVGPMVVTGLLFGLAHYEALQFLGLAGFGVVLCVLAYGTRRLGPGIVAHVAFNTVVFIAIGQFR